MRPAASRTAAPVAFEHAARPALADATMRAAVGNATTTIRARRRAVVDETFGWDALRQAAFAAREAA